MATTAGARNKVRPIIIQGHERPLTMVKYNREGDLLFTAAKDYRPCMWYADNGERIGTFEGHTGTVWCIDVNCKQLRHPHPLIEPKAVVVHVPPPCRSLSPIFFVPDLSHPWQTTAHTC